jgi:hypothetical protein
VRRSFRLQVYGYVVMPECAHAKGLQQLAAKCRSLGLSGMTTLEGLSGMTTLEGLFGMTTLEGLSGMTTLEGLSGMTTLEGLFGMTTLEGLFGMTTLEGLSGMTTLEGLSSRLKARPNLSCSSAFHQSQHPESYEGLATRRLRSQSHARIMSAGSMNKM